MVKLLENTFRAVNIGLVNELALMCDRMGIDVWEVIDAAATKPFGFMPFYPGPGPRRALHPDRPVLPVVEGARQLEYRGPLHRAGRRRSTRACREYVVRRAWPRRSTTREKAVKGSRVLVLGVAYKRDIDDVRESPALDVIELLERRGAMRHLHRSATCRSCEHGASTLTAVPLDDGAGRRHDCAVIVTDHKVFDYPAIVERFR